MVSVSSSGELLFYQPCPRRMTSELGVSKWPLHSHYCYSRFSYFSLSLSITSDDLFFVQTSSPLVIRGRRNSSVGPTGGDGWVVTLNTGWTAGDTHDGQAWKTVLLLRHLSFILIHGGQGGLFSHKDVNKIVLNPSFTFPWSYTKWYDIQLTGYQSKMI